MADDWEKEINVKKVDVLDGVRVDKWSGEDENDDIKDNWDDEEEEDTKELGPKKVEPTKEKSAKKKRLLKIAEKDRRGSEELNLTPKTPEEALAEKLERQRLQEESDLLLAKEAFGDEEIAKNSSSGLDMSLSSKEDFETFKKSLVDKLISYDKSPHYVNFLENLFRELCVSIESDDIKRLSSSLTALFNEKVKAQKAEKMKSKKKGKGFSVRVERNDDFSVGNNDLEEFDDFI